MARGRGRLNGGTNSTGRGNGKTVIGARNNVSNSQPIGATVSKNGSTSVPIGSIASRNGPTSLPVGVGEIGSTSHTTAVKSASASLPASSSNNRLPSIHTCAGDNGSASQTMNVSDNGPASLSTENERETAESVDPNSHGSVGNENVNANTNGINQPSMYDAINVSRTVNGRKAIEVIANE
ncbi:hypothetical protein M5689_023856 [Euphorbia peplus]|nr:hypothetical protein M5689_023856 [Euphorbia peplus]